MTSTTETTSSTAIVTGYTRTYVSGIVRSRYFGADRGRGRGKAPVRLYPGSRRSPKNEAKIAAYQEMQGYLYGA